MVKKKSSQKPSPQRLAIKKKDKRRSASRAGKKPAATPSVETEAIQTEFRDPYDYDAAGLSFGGVIHPLFTSVRGFAFVGALYRRLKLASDAIIGTRDYKDVFHAGEVDWDLWNALAVRGCVRLAEQAKAAGRQPDEIGLLFRAAVLWCMSPEELREKYTQQWPS